MAEIERRARVVFITEALRAATCLMRAISVLHVCLDICCSMTMLVIFFTGVSATPDRDMRPRIPSY